MKKTNFYFIIFLFFFLFNCNLSKNTYSFAIKHGGKWVLKSNYKFSISLDPTNFSFIGDLACSKIEGNYFLDQKSIKFFEIETIAKKNSKSNEEILKEEKNFIELLKNADTHELGITDFKIYKGKLLLMHLKREN